MKEKLLKEKGAVKIWVIVLVIVLCLAAAGGIFAYVKINADKDDDDSKSTSQKKEDKEKNKEDEEDDDENITNSSKKDKDEDKDDDDDDDEDSTKDTKKSSKERHFRGELDSSVTGTEGMDWTMDIYGTDEALSKLTLTIDMEDAAKEMYELLEDQYEKYDDFIKYLHDEMEDSLEGFEESFASSAGIDSKDVKGSIKWKKDEVLEMTLDFSKVDFSEMEMELNESGSVIESIVEALEDEENMKLKEVK